MKFQKFEVYGISSESLRIKNLKEDLKFYNHLMPHAIKQISFKEKNDLNKFNGENYV